MNSVFDTTSLVAGGVLPDSAAGRAAHNRAKVLGLTQEAEDAVLAPQGEGAWSTEIRAAFAVRIARLNQEESLAALYAAKYGADNPLADPADDGEAQNLGAVVAFMDKVATRARDVTAEDVAAVQAAGVSDADIVRLAELNAFMAYQVRLVAGLRLIEDNLA